MHHLLAHGAGDIFGPFSGWTFALRFGLSLIAIVPTLLTGIFLAGLLHTRTGRVWLTASFDGPPIRSILRAVIFGFLAPVGALGALPVATEMLRAKIRPGIVLSFLIVAPLFMPWSLGHTADMLGLTCTALLLAGAIFLAASVGTLTLKLERHTHKTPKPLPASGSSQLVTAVNASAAYCTGWLPFYLLVSLGASAALAAVLQPGSIEAHLGETNTTTLFELTLPLALANLSPDTATTLAGEFWRIGLLTGGIFVTLYLGSAWTLSTLLWCLQRLGRKGLIASLLWLGIALAIALLANNTIHPQYTGVTDSHGFDILTKPYNFGGNSNAAGTAQQLTQGMTNTWIPLLALTALAAVGLFNRLTAKPTTTQPSPDPNPVPSHSAPTHKPTTINAALLAVAAISLLVNIYSYYPPRSELADRLRIQSGNLFGATATIDNPEQTSSERQVARIHALNALNRINSYLTRTATADLIRGNQPIEPTPELSQALKHLNQRLLSEDLQDLSTEALALAKNLRMQVARLSHQSVWRDPERLN